MYNPDIQKVSVWAWYALCSSKGSCWVHWIFIFSFHLGPSLLNTFSVIFCALAHILEHCRWCWTIKTFQIAGYSFTERLWKMLALSLSRRFSCKKCFKNVVAMWLEAGFYILVTCKKAIAIAANEHHLFVKAWIVQIFFETFSASFTKAEVQKWDRKGVETPFDWDRAKR